MTKLIRELNQNASQQQCIMPEQTSAMAMGLTAWLECNRRDKAPSRAACGLPAVHVHDQMTACRIPIDAVLL